MEEIYIWRSGMFYEKALSLFKAKGLFQMILIDAVF